MPYHGWSYRPDGRCARIPALSAPNPCAEFRVRSYPVAESDGYVIITSQCTPVTAEETEVYTVITFRFGRIGPLVRLFFEPLARRIIRQDVEILKLQAEQLRRSRPPRFAVVESDLIGPRICQLWERALRPENGPPETGEKEAVIRF